MNYQKTALEYHSYGLRVIPVYTRDGSVTFPAWKKYLDGQTQADVYHLFDKDCDGMALLCTDGVECIDIDVKHDPDHKIGKDWFEYISLTMAKEDLERCLIQKTKSNGWHVIYRTRIYEGNQKLAYRAGSREAMIETRGKGGLVFIAPTPGYRIRRGTFADLPLIADESRRTFFRCAQELGEREPVAYAAPPPKKAPQPVTSGLTCWEDFDRQHTVDELADRYGWTVVQKAGNITRLNRPGSKHSRNIDASILTSKTGERVFYPFTTSTPYDAEKCYGPFGMYAIEEHGGDFSAAAKELYRQGFGDRMTSPTLPAAAPQAEVVTEQLPELIDKAAQTRYDYHAPIKDEKSCVWMRVGGRRYNVAGFGQIGVFIGHEKSGKSFVLSCLAAAAISGRENLNFRFQMEGRRMIWFDTEQSLYFYQISQQRIHTLAGTHTNPDNYAAYHLRRFNAAERLAIIEHFIYNTPSLGCIVIDGFVDLMKDYNDLEETQEVVGKLLKWTDELNVLLLGVLHVNKGDGKIRGHIGSELKNKCDFIINVMKTGNNEFSISNPTNRWPSFPTFEFSRDENGLPVYDADDAFNDVTPDEEMPF